MAKLPRPSGKEMIRFPERQGLRIVRIRGSHHFMQGPDCRTSIPVHGNQNLKIGTLHAILRDIHMTPTEFEQRWDA